jgi:hypothetical protein
MTIPGKFAFLDEGETLRRLGIDRDTLLGFVAQKRLRAYPGVGKGNFFRSADIERLAAELRAGEEAAETGGEAAPGSRKLFDPAYKVHVRLTADLKWYDLEDEDLRAWVREMTPDGYARQRSNIAAVIARLQRLIELMDAAAAGWQHLEAPATADPTPSAPPAKKPPRKPLPMAGPAATSAPPSEAQPPAPPAPPRAARGTGTTRGKPLPLFGGTTPPDPEQ